MAVCNTCGNSSTAVCGCKDIALTMSCVENIGINCSPDSNKCASIECAECVKSCNKENSWFATGQQGEIFIYQNGWSMMQYMQSNAVVMTNGLSALLGGYFTLFTSPEITNSTVQLQWDFFYDTNGTVIPEAFQIEYRQVENPLPDWQIVATVPANQTAITLSASSITLTPGAKYHFRIRSIDTNGDINQLDYQSVMLLIEIPY